MLYPPKEKILAKKKHLQTRPCDPSKLTHVCIFQFVMIAITNFNMSDTRILGSGILEALIYHTIGELYGK